jgi:nucleoside-diphosphate-sugar epimerase
MAKRILLTGATGYLGSRLAKALLADGFEVIALKRTTSSLENIGEICSKLIMLDVDKVDLELAFAEFGTVDAVIHVAANYGRNGETEAKIAEDNLIFPLRLLRCAAEAGVGLFLNSDTALNKHMNAYSLSKSQFANWGVYFSRQGKLRRFINLKLEHFYGAGDDGNKFTSYVIANCLSNVAELKLTLGEQRRDFIYIDDAVAAYMRVLERHKELPEGFAELDVGCGDSVTIRQFVEIVHKLTGSTAMLNFGAVPYRSDEPMFLQADTKALMSLGWRCRYTLEQGLEIAISEARKRSKQIDC